MSESREDHTALLAVDLQFDFLADRGRMRVARRQVNGLVTNANRLIALAGERGWPVVYVVNEFPRWNVPVNLIRRFAAVKGSPGAELDPRIAQVEGPRIPKWTGNGFANPELTKFLKSKGITKVVLAGVYTEACVLRTALGARAKGFNPVVVADAVASASNVQRSAGLGIMRLCGIDAVTTDSFATPSG
jgi:nicotinamidase-related amidase